MGNDPSEPDNVTLQEAIVNERRESFQIQILVTFTGDLQHSRSTRSASKRLRFLFLHKMKGWPEPSVISSHSEWKASFSCEPRNVLRLEFHLCRRNEREAGITAVETVSRMMKLPTGWPAQVTSHYMLNMYSICLLQLECPSHSKQELIKINLWTLFFTLSHNLLKATAVQLNL